VKSGNLLYILKSLEARTGSRTVGLLSKVWPLWPEQRPGRHEPIDGEMQPPLDPNSSSSSTLCSRMPTSRLFMNPFAVVSITMGLKDPTPARRYLISPGIDRSIRIQGVRWGSDCPGMGLKRTRTFLPCSAQATRRVGQR